MGVVCGGGGGVDVRKKREEEHCKTFSDKKAGSVSS